MAKKSKKDKYETLKNPRKPDKELIQAFAVCGFVREEQALSILSQRRFNTFQKANYVEKVEIERYGKKENLIGYRLTKEGKKYAQEYVISQKCNSAKAMKHDLACADHFFSLSKDERASAISEAELQYEMKMKYEDKEITYDEYKASSCVDFVYKSDESGELNGFEIVTKNYTSEELQSKRDFCSTYGCSYVQKRI